MLIISSVGEDMDKHILSSTADWSINWCRQPLEGTLVASINFKTHLDYDTEILFLTYLHMRNFLTCLQGGITKYVHYSSISNNKIILSNPSVYQYESG